MTAKIFYVYAYLRNKDSKKVKEAKSNTFYYIGKGKGNRYRKKHSNVPVPQDHSNIILLKENLTNTKACYWEKHFIKLYGRIDLGTGILRNLTDGGEGAEGYKHSNKTKKKLRILSTGIKQSDETIEKRVSQFRGKKNPKISKRMSGSGNPMYGKTHPNKGKKMPQISEKVKGKKKPEGHGAKVSETRIKLGLGNTWGGKKRPELSEFWKNNPNPGLEKTRINWECEHCGKKGSGASNYVRWHSDNCKFFKAIK